MPVLALLPGGLNRCRRSSVLPSVGVGMSSLDLFLAATILSVVVATAALYVVVRNEGDDPW